MKMVPVKSSNIAEIGFDPESRTLGVKFKNGGLYHYRDFDAEKHATMMDPTKTPSIGSFIHANVKGKHPHSKIADSDTA